MVYRAFSHIITVDFIVCGCTGDIQSHHHSWLHCVQVHGDIQSHCHGWLLAYAGGNLSQGIIRSFIEGQARSWHFFNKLGWWLTVPGRMARDSSCCAGQLQCYWLCMGEACAQWVSSSVCRVLQLAEVLQVQHMVLVALPGWQVGVAGAMFVVTCLSGLMASGWCSCMWSWTHQYRPLPMTWTMYDPWSAAWMTVAGSHRHLASLRTDTVCPANSGAFCQQPWQSWFAALRETCWSRWSWSAVACGWVWQICYGTVVHRACW